MPRAPASASRRRVDAGQPRERAGAAFGMMANVPSTAPIRPHPVSPARPVPDAITRPYYVANGGRPSGRQVELLRDRGTIDRLRDACAAARRVLDVVGRAV